MYRNYQNLSKEDRASGCESMGVNVARRLDEMSNRPAGLIENDDDLAEVKRAVALFDEGMPIYETIDAPNAEVSNYQDRLDIVRDEIVEIMEDFEWWKRNAIRR